MLLSELIDVRWGSQRRGLGVRVNIHSLKGPDKQYGIIMGSHTDQKPVPIPRRDTITKRVNNTEERVTIVDLLHGNKVVATGKIIAEKRSGREHIEVISDPEPAATTEAAAQ